MSSDTQTGKMGAINWECAGHSILERTFRLLVIVLGALFDYMSEIMYA